MKNFIEKKKVDKINEKFITIIVFTFLNVGSLTVISTASISSIDIIFNHNILSCSYNCIISLLSINYDTTLYKNT